MKIIELTETQFKNYSKLHSARSYMQTVEYAHYKKGIIYYLGFINEKDKHPRPLRHCGRVSDTVWQRIKPQVKYL